MLRKLIKHEFRATGRIMLPLYLILLLVSAGANFSLRAIDTDNHILNVLGGIILTGFVVLLFSVCIITVVLMARRFQRNLLGDEGYLMFTLPVSVHKHIWSKLLVSAVWFILSGIALFLSILILTFNVEVVGTMMDFFRECWRLFVNYPLDGLHMALLLVHLMVFVFIGCCVGCLHFYSAMSIGYSLPNHKMLFSVAAFFGIEFITQFISNLLIFPLGESLNSFLLNNPLFSDPLLAAHSGLLFLDVLTLLGGVILYFISVYFLKNRLNLE